MNGSLRFGTPSACAHSSSFAASFVVMIATVSAAQNNKCLVKGMLFTICCMSVGAALSVTSVSSFLNGASDC